MEGWRPPKSCKRPASEKVIAEFVLLGKTLDTSEQALNLQVFSRDAAPGGAEGARPTCLGCQSPGGGCSNLFAAAPCANHGPRSAQFQKGKVDICSSLCKGEGHAKRLDHPPALYRAKPLELECMRDGVLQMRAILF